MTNTDLQLRLKDYREWRFQLIQAVEDYHAWLERYELNHPETTQRIQSLLENLRSERLLLAFAAEFSRGKTELINALFFSDTGVRLLPSSPGRTTMCPTEIFYDHEGGSYIRLLPIDSRLDPKSLGEFKRNVGSWMHVALDATSPQQMQEAFRELVATKKVTVDEAKRLGLFNEDVQSGQSGGSDSDLVDIPCWRHALVSFPHYLLKQGLAILDTPGLNALGAEPELTINMLPSAQAVVFVLAADTGVTKSDLDIWNHHVQTHRGDNKRGLAVVMNKIDAMWDDLQGDEGLERSIRSQTTNTAKILEISEQAIFPVSAKQALLAKVKGDEGLLARSRIDALENYLAQDVVRDRQRLVLENLVRQMGQMIGESDALLESQVAEIEKQLSDMRSVDGKNQSMTKKMMSDTREDQTRYLASVESFQASRRVFAVQARSLLEALAPEKIDQVLRRGRRQIEGNLTTIGMKQSMGQVLGQLREVLHLALDNTEETRRLVRVVYKKFQEEHGFKDVKPALFSLRNYQVELEAVFEQGEQFRNSASSVLMTQGIVVDKLYGTIIAKARDIFVEAHREALGWSGTVLNPLLKQVKDHKHSIESRLEILRKVSQSSESLDGEIAQLEQQLVPIRKQQSELAEIKLALRIQGNEPARFGAEEADAGYSTMAMST